jgi:cytosine/adenosine deaminase-related metal-dependent hydrolase
MQILLTNATFINWETLDFKPSHILVEEGITGKIQLIEQLPAEEELKKFMVIDCKGKYVTKSFACGHHHAYSALAKGMPPPKKNPENFFEILKYIWWTLDKCLDKEMIEASALATTMACAKNGVTFVIDHHASPNCVNGSLEIIAAAFEKIGLSHLLCYEISDRDGNEIAKKGLLETEKYLQKHQGLVGLHASFTVSDEIMKDAVALSLKNNSGIHMHVAEDYFDQEQCLKKHGLRVVERLEKHGVLDFEKTILAHCIHLNDHEKDIIKNSKATVVQNMESNLNNKVGRFTGNGLSPNIMFGTDGMHSDMLQSSKFAFFAGQQHDAINYAETYKRFRQAHHYIQKNNFHGDSENNLVVMDYDTPTEMNKENFLSHFIFGIESKHVQHVISSGRLIVKDQQIQTVNEEEVLRITKEVAKKLWTAMKK